MHLLCVSAFSDSAYRAIACTCSARDALISINYELSVSLRDSIYRAVTCTCSARNAAVIDYVCHDLIPPRMMISL